MSKVNLSDLIGIPFKKRGKDKSGIDCYHLAQEVFKRYDKHIPDYRDSCNVVYSCGLKSFAINKAIDKGRKDWSRIEEPVEPCLVVLRYDENNPDMCSHIGVFIGERKFIHVLEKINSCIQRIDHPMWKNLIEGFYQYNG
jgi:hypothetical protein